MTLDDLDKLFEEAATPKSFVGQVDYRKGVAAVVMALRDDLFPAGREAYVTDSQDIFDWFNEILGDAGEFA